SAAAGQATRLSSARRRTRPRSDESQSPEGVARRPARPSPLRPSAAVAEPALRRRHSPAVPARPGARVAALSSAWPRRYASWDRGFTRSLCIGLSRLSMCRVAAAPTAVLAQLDTVRRVPLGLRRLVVPPLAVGAREGDRVSYSGCQLKSYWLRAWKRPEGSPSRPAVRL